MPCAVTSLTTHGEYPAGQSGTVIAEADAAPSAANIIASTLAEMNFFKSSPFMVWQFYSDTFMKLGTIDAINPHLASSTRNSKVKQACQ